MLIRGLGMRQLLDWSENDPGENGLYIVFCICLVLMAGCMSGLTLGLLSMDIVDLEVLIRSGSPADQRRAKNIVPIVKNAHYLLVTLLLCNAAAMETLPIFLDKMVDESVAIIISVTAVLLFGEIIPQAVCSKHGLMIGSIMALPVRFLMIITAPISWPMSKVLDMVLGGDHASLFRRKQLRALVTIHAKDEGFGGKLTSDEIQIITGAMDLTQKTAYMAMTGLEKVFMLSSTQKLDDSTVEAIMSSKPFSRLPVYRGENKKDIIGLILVKELLEYVKKYPDSPVSSLKIRPLPRLSASTPMYDMLKLFRTGRSHMALLTQPLLGEEQGQAKPDAATAAAAAAAPAARHAHAAAALQAAPPPPPCGQLDPHGACQLLSGELLQPLGQHCLEQHPLHAAAATAPCGRAHHEHTPDHQHHHRGHHALPKSASLGGVPAPTLSQRPSFVGHPSPSCDGAIAGAAAGAAAAPSPRTAPSPRPLEERSCATLSSGDHATLVVSEQVLESHAAMSANSRISRSRSAMNSIKRFFRTSHGVDDHGQPLEGRGSGRTKQRSSSGSSSSSEDDLDDLLPVPLIALPGEPIGIITIEDVIEELMQFEIVDETDRFVDNEQSLLVEDAKLERDLPDNIRSVLSQVDMAQPDPQPQQPSMLASIMASVLWPSNPARAPAPGTAGPAGAAAPAAATAAAAGPAAASQPPGNPGLIAVMARDLFRTSRPQGKRGDSLELAPLLETPSQSSLPAGAQPQPQRQQQQQQVSEPGSGSALAAALLVAAGKRSPGLASSLGGSSRSLVSLAAQAKGSKELFSYLGPTQQQQQQQQQQKGGAAAVPAAAKPSDPLFRVAPPAESSAPQTPPPRT